MIDAIHRAIANACLGVHAHREMARDMRGFFAAHGVMPDDIDAVLSAPHHLFVYRSLVRNGLSSVVLRMLPRTRARLNAACAGRFDADFAEFLEDPGPRSHHLRDVPSELFAWAGPRWRSDTLVPPYVCDLAAHELAQFAVASSESADIAAKIEPVALDRPLVFVESTRVAHYAWAVHELSHDEGASDEPARRQVHLLAYRDAEHAVQWLEVTPLAAAILDRLLSGEIMGTAVQQGCAARGAVAADALADIAGLLADLGERGVLVGARRFVQDAANLP